MVRATKIMEIIEEDHLVANAAQTGAYLQERLLKIAEKYPQVSNIRGKGLLTAFDFSSKNMRDEFIKKGLEKNVMFLGCGNQTIRFRPALIMSNDHIDAGLNVMEQIVAKL